MMLHWIALWLHLMWAFCHRGKRSVIYVCINKVCEQASTEILDFVRTMKVVTDEIRRGACAMREKRLCMQGIEDAKERQATWIAHHARAAHVC